VPKVELVQSVCLHPEWNHRCTGIPAVGAGRTQCQERRESLSHPRATVPQDEAGRCIAQVGSTIEAHRATTQTIEFDRQEMALVRTAPQQHLNQLYLDCPDLGLSEVNVATDGDAVKEPLRRLKEVHA
jgi:hypothetical protein